MVLRAQNYLTLGHQSHTWLDTEFRYGYFLMLLVCLSITVDREFFTVKIFSSLAIAMKIRHAKI